VYLLKIQLAIKNFAYKSLCKKTINSINITYNTKPMPA